MKRKLNSLIGFTIGATDGEIGKVKEFYFDDQSWTIRYLIVETGGWLFGRKLLISPQALLAPDWEGKSFPVNLTMERVKGSPQIDTNMPVSRKQEDELHGYYPWTSYWDGGGMWAGGMGTSGMVMPATLPLEEAIHNNAMAEAAAKNNDPHLRSTDQVSGYTIKATDGSIGNLDDLIISENSRKIDFLIVDTGNWFPGKKVLISPGWIKEINWETSSVVVDASEDQVKNSPEYQPEESLTDAYEANLQNYYGRFITNK